MKKINIIGAAALACGIMSMAFAYANSSVAKSECVGAANCGKATSGMVRCSSNVPSSCTADQKNQHRKFCTEKKDMGCASGKSEDGSTCDLTGMEIACTSANYTCKSKTTGSGSDKVVTYYWGATGGTVGGTDSSCGKYKMPVSGTSSDCVEEPEA